MFSELSRPYKERSAGETINVIREILAPLDLLPQETFRANLYPGVHSVSLELPEAQGGFRANGKGRNTHLCLASAYAEFLERTQNGLYATFSRTNLTTLKNDHGFYQWPDERFLSEKDFNELPEAIIADMVRLNPVDKAAFIDSYFQRVKTNGLPGLISVPFYDTSNEKTIYLPLNLLLLAVGSNGMAAGNTRAEAIFQALCELLERWGAAEIFHHRLTPPAIPRDYLRQYAAEFDIIQRIEKSGKYRVIVKDFSAGQGIPALGLLVRNVAADTYRLNVGADTSFQVALSRCLTEIYQGFKDEEMFDARLLPVPQQEASYFEKDDELSLYQRSLVFNQFTKDNTGLFPLTLFGEQADYPFDPSHFSTQDSYEAEVKALVAYFHKTGRNVYIRDVSFLAFPAVFVYVPDVSAQGRKSALLPTAGNNHLVLALDEIEPLVFRLKQCTAAELQTIAAVLEKFDAGASIAQLFNIRLRQASTWQQVNVAFLLTLIWLRLEQYGRAREALEHFIRLRGDQNPYYLAAEMYLAFRADGLNAQRTREQLSAQPFDPHIVNQVCEDLHDPTQAFNFISLPGCPDCEQCQLYTDCLTSRTLSVAHRLYPRMRTNQIDQRQQHRWITQP